MLIRWTKPAVDDLTHICDYTEEHFGSAQARRAAIAIYDSVESLRALPSKGRPGRRPNTRWLRSIAFCTVRRGGRELAHAPRILERQVRRAVQPSLIPQLGGLDAGGGGAIREAAALHLGQHGRREELPGWNRAAAQQVQGEIENVHQVGDGDAQRLSHGSKNGQGAIV